MIVVYAIAICSAMTPQFNDHPVSCLTVGNAVYSSLAECQASAPHVQWSTGNGIRFPTYICIKEQVQPSYLKYHR